MSSTSIPQVAQKSTTQNGQATKTKQPNMLQAALKYAAIGWHVFPCHTPITKEGWSCSCEAWRRKKDPNYNCKWVGKHPRIKDGVHAATTDPEQINQWWKQWPQANIGVNCGASGLIVLDEDAYKEVYGDLGDLLSPDEQETVKQLSGSHQGSHLVYAMPEGKAYGNAEGDLPDGLNIRGVGGYIIVAPSLHKSGNRYEWIEGYGPDEMNLQTLPEPLQTILDAAQDKKAPAQSVTFTEATTEAPDMAKWHISKEIRQLISKAPAVGERSEADYKVCLSLVYAGATDDDILAVFEHNSIGKDGKFAESGKRYLSLTISKARAYMDEHPRTTTTTKAQAVEEVVTFAEIMDEIQALDAASSAGKVDKSELMKYLLHNAARCDTLPALDDAMLRVELQQRKITKAWIDGDWASVKNEARKAAEAAKPESTKGKKKRLSVVEYCRDILDGPLTKGMKVIRERDGNDEFVIINQCEKRGENDVLFYSIEESSELVPDTELFVEIDARSLSDYWLDQLRELGHTFKLNVLEDMVEVDGKRMDDVTRSKIYLGMKSANDSIPKTYVDDLINVLAAENTYHPVQNYLNSLVWDGKDHLSLMLARIKGDGREVTYPNGQKTQLHWQLIQRWLLGCVARALDGDKEAEFKHQTPMLVFIGKQGLGKSSWVRWLCSGLGSEYHRESPLNPHAPDDVRSAVTKWIWEVSELGSSLRKGDRDGLKSFITQEWHTYRKPWGRANITKPTLACLVGTLNPETGFLDDPTGHRRFLPVTITDLSHDYKQVVDVNQMWAQLVHMYRNGKSPELSKSEKQALADTYEEHEVENPLETYLRMYFKIEPGNADMKCFTAEIMQRLQAFDINISNNPKVAGREINDVLAPMKLTRKKMSIGGGKGWGWEGIEPNTIPVPSKRTSAAED